jgi:hypothetical protein
MQNLFIAAPSYDQFLRRRIDDEACSQIEQLRLAWIAQRPQGF